MTTVNLSATIDSTDYSIPLGLEVWLDNTCLLDVEHVSNTVMLDHTFPEVDRKHQLKFVLKNKLPTHTVIDSDNNIVKDACLSISNFKIDDIDISDIFKFKAVYTHDFNGTQPAVNDSFYGTMGCNGSVEFEFTAPFYLWLLENM